MEYPEDDWYEEEEPKCQNCQMSFENLTVEEIKIHSQNCIQ